MKFLWIFGKDPDPDPQLPLPLPTLKERRREWIGFLPHEVNKVEKFLAVAHSLPAFDTS